MHAAAVILKFAGPLWLRLAECQVYASWRCEKASIGQEPTYPIGDMEEGSFAHGAESEVTVLPRQSLVLFSFSPPLFLPQILPTEAHPPWLVP